MKKENKDINLQKLSNAILRIVSHRFIVHTSENDWGGSVLVMENSGKAFARTYWFNDDNSTIYFDWLSVDDNVRGNGIASILLNSHIKVAKEFNTTSMLWVTKGTWMQDWYKRKGYTDYKDYEKESNAIWQKLEP